MPYFIFKIRLETTISSKNTFKFIKYACNVVI